MTAVPAPVIVRIGRALAPIPVCAVALVASWMLVGQAWVTADGIGVLLALAVLVVAGVAVGHRTRFGLAWGAGLAVGGGTMAFVALMLDASPF